MIDDLNQAPQELIDHLRSLSDTQRHMLLWSLVVPDNRPYLEKFIKDVVVSGADVRKWGRGRILVPSRSVSDLLTRPVRDILRPLAREKPIEAEGWFRVDLGTLTYASSPYAGAPATLHADTHYSWPAPPHSIGIEIGAVPLVAVARVDVWARRWVAYRASQGLDGVDWKAERPEDLARRLGVDPAYLSTDGRRALAALLAEGATET